MVDECVRCMVPGIEVRLFDAIYEGRMALICERCSLIENVPVIKKPDVEQLKQTEEKFGVFDRMKRMSDGAYGMKEKKDDTFFIEDRIRELDKKPELELPVKDKLKLIEHYHWEIMKHRRRKGLTPERLSEAVGESVAAIEMVEKGQLPENAESLINKLEQFFQVRLRIVNEVEEYGNKKPVLLDSKGNELDVIPEPEIEIIENDEVLEELNIAPQDELNKNVEVKENVEVVDGEFGSKEKESAIETELRRDRVDVPTEFDIRSSDISQINIKDLRDIHRKKIEVTKQERIEEMRRIEDKQRLIEAKREELRLNREKESRKIDSELGGIELLDGEDFSNEEDIKRIEEFDSELK